MSTEDEQILVELEPDEGAKPEAAAKPEPAPEDGVKKLQEQLEAAQKATALAEERVAAERARAQKAEQEAAQRAREAQEARSQSGDAEAGMVSSALSAAQAERDSAMAAYEAAFEAGDSKKAAEAQSRLSRAEAKIVSFEATAAELADRKERQAKTTTETRQEQHQPADINQVIDGMNLLPTEREWLKAHPEALMDRARNAELDVAYMRATRQGLQRGTPDYFAFIEDFMGYAKKPAAETQSEPERTSIVAAPVSREARSTATGERVSQTKVKLTPKQVEIAEMMGLSVEDYARGYLQMDSDKRANPEKYAIR